MSKLILDSLDDKQRVVFNKLSAFRNLGVLGGGTALSLQIGHRKSFDFDIFTDAKITKNVWQKVKKVFGTTSQKTLDTEEQLDLITPEGIKVTFFHDDCKPLFELFKNDTIALFDLRDIATNKAYTLGRRPKWRDYVDLFFLLQGNAIKLVELIKLSKKKFGNDFSERLFLEQLVYWEDINDYTIEFLKERLNPGKIKEFLKSETDKFTKGQL